MSETPKIKVVQDYRVTRTLVIDVEGDKESALEAVQIGAFDLPEWSDERWKEVWELVVENSTPAE
jgi:hypothetical protein